MEPDKGNFNLSGPVYLTSVNWNNSDHRRIIIASLVEGVYTLEHDRQKNRGGIEDDTWWSKFNFVLYGTLKDKYNSIFGDNSIFGAIYEFKLSASCYNNAPKYVVAFRGTVLKPATILRDLCLDRKCFIGTLRESSPGKVAMKAIEDIVSREGANNILVAGHSLGAAFALLTGKNMTKKGCPIEAYLFNPPFPSLPTDLTNDPDLTHWIGVVSSVIKLGISVAEENNDDSFSKLCEWVPKVFVNPADPICCGYIGYFEHRKRMLANGDVAAMIERRATRISIRSTFSRLFGKDSEALHLLPSAYLTINKSTPVLVTGHQLKKSIKQNGIMKGSREKLRAIREQWLKAHEIRQWWDPSFRHQSELHKFK